MTDETYTQFAPFSAINDFMLADFRLHVLQYVYSNLSNLPEAYRQRIDVLTRALVIVPGFRNPVKAPPLIKARNAAKPFEKSSELVVNMLQAWALLHQDLGNQVYTILSSLDWEVFPLDADRAKMPGFIPSWPDEHDFSSINRLFEDQYPETKHTSDEISLMIVWVSLRLPYDLENQADEVD